FDRSRIPPQSSAFGSLPALDLHHPPGLVWILVGLPPNGHGHWIWDDRNYPPRSVQGLYTEDELERVAAEKHTYPWPLPKSTNSQKLALSSKPAALSIERGDAMQLVRFSEQAGISPTIRPRPVCLTIRTCFAEQ